MNIRLEQPEDYREVENLTREAFWNVYAPGCVEHYVLNQYRSNPDFIPELDFVMEIPLPNSSRVGDGSKPKIIGHVMFSRAQIILDTPLSGEAEGASSSGEAEGTLECATFGPISIHPDYKRRGYGLKLLNHALEEARKMGIGFVCMEGNIDFYKHAGFVVASSLGIHYHAESKDAEVPYFLAQELIPGYLNGIEGTYHTPKGYYVAFENKETFEAYEATFPKKEKKLQAGQLKCTLRPFVYDDASIILSWCKDKHAFRLWSADIYADFPASPDDMMKQYDSQNMFPLTMTESKTPCGHILLRYPSEDKSVIRFGFIIVDNALRGRGYGKQLLQLAIDYASNNLGAQKITLGVFCDNHSAIECYKSVGFKIVGEDTYAIDGEIWKGYEMEYSEILAQ